MDATKLYCRKASEFDIFKDFNPEDFEFIKYVIEHECLLTAAGKGFVNRALIHDFRLYQKEIQCGPGGVVLYNYLEYIMSKFLDNNKSDNALSRWRKEPREKLAEEEMKIFHLLDESGYIRKDCIHESVLIASMVNDAPPVKTEDGEWSGPNWAGYMENCFDIFYEKIKPTTGKELSLITDILHNELTSTQYEVIRHYIFKGWKVYYAYTEAEYEALAIALKNIQDIPSIKTKINEVMDNTLF
ncbi:hypothetical protein IJH24_00720 [Candidatus Saccharibacteria bacterium]|nr:hypothetical protein [Candidatus Saccharibacteria bacterium]